MRNVLLSLGEDRVRDAEATVHAAWARVNKTIGAQAMLFAILQDLRDHNEAPVLRMKMAERQTALAHDRETQMAAYHQAEGVAREAAAWLAMLRDTEPVARDTEPVVVANTPAYRIVSLSVDEEPHVH